LISPDESAWIATDTEGFRQAGMMGKPVLMDFYAEWCTACKELDEKTWPDASVRSVLERFILVKLDLTKNDDRARAYQSQYGIIGMPTVILFDASGREKHRFEGYRPPEEVAATLREYSE
jgi:thiol:disulfide interchange protein DsbD